MASKQPLPTQKSFPKTVWVECDLGEDHKKHLKSLKVTAEKTMQGLDSLVVEGYKLSMSFETKNDCVGVYLTQPKPEGQEYTVCLSARGPSLDKALMVLLYKHFEMLQGDWSGKVKAGSYIDPWG